MWKLKVEVRPILSVFDYITRYSLEVNKFCGQHQKKIKVVIGENISSTGHSKTSQKPRN